MVDELIERKGLLNQGVPEGLKLRLTGPVGLVGNGAEDERDGRGCRVDNEQVDGLPAHLRLAGADVEDDEVGAILLDALVGDLARLKQQGVETLIAEQRIKDTNKRHLIIDDLTAALLTRALLGTTPTPASGQLLLFHVAPGTLRSTDLSAETTAPTLAGEELQVMAVGGSVTINDAARVIETDIDGGDSVVRAIDQVLLPDTLALPPASGG